jgi:hypothetical protein
LGNMSISRFCANPVFHAFQLIYLDV